MDPDRRRTRVWVLPTVFALVALSWPAQLYVAERWSEPYPGLFQPKFSAIPGHHQAVKYRAVVLKADGQVVDEKVLFPGTNFGRRHRLLQAMFPPNGGIPNVDRTTRERMRSRLTDALGTEPRFLTATWERRRFGLDSRRTSVIKTLAEYRLDLADGAR